MKILQIERQLLREKQTVATCLLCTNEGRLTANSGHSPGTKTPHWAGLNETNRWRDLSQAVVLRRIQPKPASAEPNSQTAAGIGTTLPYTLKEASPSRVTFVLPL